MTTDAASGVGVRSRAVPGDGSPSGVSSGSSSGSSSGVAPEAGRCACGGAGLRATLRADVDRFVWAMERHGADRVTALPRLMLSPRLWAVVNHRFAHAVATRVRVPVLRSVLDVAGFVTQRVIRNACGIQIDPLAHIGPGLFFPHEGTIVIGQVRIGANATVSHGVTLGRSEREADGADDVPTLGDRVWLGPGAVVAGRVDVGSDAAVGANSVVLRDVPAGAVVLGVPAKLLSRRGSFDMVHYRGNDTDPARLAAMAADPGPDAVPDPPR